MFGCLFACRLKASRRRFCFCFCVGGAGHGSRADSRGSLLVARRVAAALACGASWPPARARRPVAIAIAPLLLLPLLPLARFGIGGARRDSADDCDDERRSSLCVCVLFLRRLPWLACPRRGSSAAATWHLASALAAAARLLVVAARRGSDQHCAPLNSTTRTQAQARARDDNGRTDCAAAVVVTNKRNSPHMRAGLARTKPQWSCDSDNNND